MHTPLWVAARPSLLFAVGLILLTGCSFGAGDRPDTGEVTGVVTLGGAPLEGARVTFQPESGRPSSAVTDASGKYVLMYSEDVKGAKTGPHTVTISKPNETFDSDGELTKSVETVPAKYNTASELKETVEPGENTIDFAL